MAKGKFVFGFALGIAAGLAGKYIYDNREMVVSTVGQKAGEIKDEVNDFVDYASKKASDIGKGVAKFAEEYSDLAKEQFSELKNVVGDDFFAANEQEEDTSEEEAENE